MLNFVLFKLRVTGLRQLVGMMSPLWQARAELNAKRVKQAPALDLLDLLRLEHAILVTSDRFRRCQLGAVMLMITGGFRFSDLQRIIVGRDQRGRRDTAVLFFRSKASRIGFASGVLEHGPSGPDWGSSFMLALRDYQWAEDFIFSEAPGTIGSYACMRRLLREILVFSPS